MTDTLRREVVRGGESLYAIARDTGLDKSCLVRFMREETSLRLDKADILAAHLGLELVKRPDRRR